MGRGQRKKYSLKQGKVFDSREVIFKGLGQSRNESKQMESLEAEKFQQARKRKDAEEELPSKVDSYGNRYWYNKKGELHRDGDLPAMELIHGTREWYQNGKLHRENDKPAAEYANGSKYWLKNGSFHRDGGKPAIEDAEGFREWWQEGQLHRDGDLPAVERADGSREWWNHGKLIRKETI